MSSMNLNLIGHLRRPIVLFMIFLAITPLFSSHQFYRHLLTLIFLFAFFSAAWNLISGFGGQFSLGHVAFFGIGAYITSFLYIDYGIPPWIGMLISAIGGILLSLIIGFATFRLRAFFFALSTIACAEALNALFTYWRILAPTGLGTTIPYNPGFINLTFDSELPYTYIAYFLLVIVVITTFLIINSRLGYYLRAIGGEEEAAMSLGVNVFRVKLLVFAVSALFTAIGGGFYSMYVQYIEPAIVFNIDFSIQFAIFTIVGGMATVPGPIIGSALLVPLSTFFRSWVGGLYTPLGFFMYGFILVFIIMVAPGGMMKGINSLHKVILKRS